MLGYALNYHGTNIFFLCSEMRQKFDDGEDPLDPEQKSGFQQNPFGGFPFGSGQGFTFKFKWT